MMLGMSQPSKPANATHPTALVLAAHACMFIFGIILLLMGSLLPTLAVNNVQAGNLGSFPLAGILVATVVIGPVLDTVGAQAVLAVALGLIAVSLALLPDCHRYAELAAVALAYGLGGGILNTATNALVADLRAEGRGAALNRLGVSFTLGALAAPLFMSLASRPGGATLAGSTHFPALGQATILRLLAAATAVILIPVVGLRFPAPTRSGSRLTDLLGVLKEPMVWAFGLLLFFESGNENCLFVWTGKMAAGLFKLSARDAALTLGGLTAAMGIGRLSASQYLRFLGSRKTLLLSATVVAAGAAITYTAKDIGTALVGVMAMGLGMSAIFPTGLGVAGDRFPGQTGTVFGAVMTLALIGGTSGPALGGWLAVHGLADVLWIPMVSAVAIATLTLVVTRR